MMPRKDMATAEQNDAQLVSKSLAGNRAAFEQIVARYQSLICSMTYSGTGDVARSEDIAQDTFLAAWKQLANLREPERLRSWLCGIARNLINNSVRKQAREPLHKAETLDVVSETPATGLPPSEEAVNREEHAIVWSAIERIPELYREPLVLFYRENQSVETVAHQLDLSEDAVKQRLSRGREMLREEVVEIIEGALKRSGPGKTFTIAVMAALPAALAGSAKAASLAMAGKTAAPPAKAILAGGVLGLLAGILSAIYGIAIGAFSLWFGWNKIPYKRLRDFIKRNVIREIISYGVFLALILLLMLLMRHRPAAFGIMVAASSLAFSVFVAVWHLRRLRQYRRILAEEIAAGTPPLPQSRFVRDISRAINPKRKRKWKWKARQWRSRWSFLGLPLVDINFSSQAFDTRNSSFSRSEFLALIRQQAVACGWIALGDRAHGILFACGNIAIGGIAIGALSAGGLAIGVVAALGLVSVGSGSVGFVAIGIGAVGGMFAGGVLAIGWIASGVCALGWKAAAGLVAYSLSFASGRAVAIAPHANDAASREFISRNIYFQTGDWLGKKAAPILAFLASPPAQFGILLVSVLGVLPSAIRYYRRRTALPIK